MRWVAELPQYTLPRRARLLVALLLLPVRVALVRACEGHGRGSYTILHTGQAREVEGRQGQAATRFG
jgi:hypothetical protein